MSDDRGGPQRGAGGGRTNPDGGWSPRPQRQSSTADELLEIADELEEEGKSLLRQARQLQRLAERLDQAQPVDSRPPSRPPSSRPPSRPSTRQGDSPPPRRSSGPRSGPSGERPRPQGDRPERSFDDGERAPAGERRPTRPGGAGRFEKPARSDKRDSKGGEKGPPRERGGPPKPGWVPKGRR